MKSKEANRLAHSTVHRRIALLFGALGLVLLVWGFALNLSGHESAQSWSLIGIGAATFGSMGYTWRRR